MATEQVTVLGVYVSMYSMRVTLTLKEKGVDYEFKEEDLANKSPLLLEMNPVHKKIPVLIHNGKPVSESLIIVEYIDEVWNTKAPLLPADPYQRAQARFWSDFSDKKLFPYLRTLYATKEEVLEADKKEFIDVLKLLEGELGDKPYFGGDHFGFLDIALITYYCWFHAYEMFGNFKIEPLCPKLIAWAKRCMERKSVAESLADPNKVYDFCQAARKKLDI